MLDLALSGLLCFVFTYHSRNSKWSHLNKTQLVFSTLRQLLDCCMNCLREGCSIIIYITFRPYMIMHVVVPSCAHSIGLHLEHVGPISFSTSCACNILKLHAHVHVTFSAKIEHWIVHTIIIMCLLTFRMNAFFCSMWSVPQLFWHNITIRRLRRSKHLAASVLMQPVI